MKQAKKDQTVYVIILFCFLIVIFGSLAYFACLFYVFNKNYTMNGINELSNFSTFNSYFVSLCNLILLSFISYLTYKSSNSYNRQQVTPLLELRVTTSKIKGNIDSWFLFNCTNAAARNVSVRFYSDDKVTRWVACYSVGGNAETELIWLKRASKIEVLYTDIFEEHFYKLSYQSLIGKTETIDRVDFYNILENRINHADLIIQYGQYINHMNSSNANLFTDIFDWVKVF